MKQAIIWIAVILLILLLLPNVTPPQKVVKYQYKDSIITKYDTMLLKVFDTIQIIEKQTAKESYEHFKQVYGEPDTVFQEVFVVDSSQIKACLECSYLLSARGLESKRNEELYLTADSLLIITTDELNKCLSEPKKDRFIEDAREITFGVLVGVVIGWFKR